MCALETKGGKNFVGKKNSGGERPTSNYDTERMPRYLWKGLQNVILLDVNNICLDHHTNHCTSQFYFYTRIAMTAMILNLNKKQSNIHSNKHQSSSGEYKARMGFEPMMSAMSTGAVPY